MRKTNETREQYINRRVSEQQNFCEKKGITDYDMADFYQCAEEEWDDTNNEPVIGKELDEFWTDVIENGSERME